ncbi:MAG: hypothetical protein RLY61_552 [Candidatus Parcubacteria bacterium]|jgi:hypothetical protein
MFEQEPLEVTVSTDTGWQLAHREGSVVIEHIPGGGGVGAVQLGDGSAIYRVEDARGDVYKGNLGIDEGIAVALSDGMAASIHNS